MTENSDRSHPSIGSERNFGLTFFTVFGLIGLWPVIEGENVRWWFISVALFCLVLSLIRPTLLSFPNRLWFKFGVWLGGIVSPLTMGVVFFCVVTPTGFFMRLFGKDPLNEKIDPQLTTYWVDKKVDKNEPNSMKNQF